MQDDADEMLAVCRKRGHKQMYWLEEQKDEGSKKYE